MSLSRGLQPYNETPERKREWAPPPELQQLALNFLATFFRRHPSNFLNNDRLLVVTVHKGPFT